MGGGAETVIPPGEIDGALGGLLAHIRMAQRASKWLAREECLAASAYFSILCLEEIARHLVMSGRRGSEGGVLREDMDAVASHEKRLCVFWDMAVAGSVAPPGAGSPEGRRVASALSGAKEAAVYFGFAGGSADTLEGRLGAQRLDEASRLLRSLVAGGIREMLARAEEGCGSRRAAHPDPQAGMRAGMARVMEIIKAPERATPGKGEAVIPLVHLDHALEALWDHAAVLDKIAHMLYKRGHDAASVFFSVISLEECAKYYILARFRRRQEGVLGRDLPALRTHKTKLSVFFKDVSDFLGDRNRTADPHTYAIIHPKAFLKLNGLKEMAIYFNYAAGGTMTLRELFGRATRDFSHYLRKTVQGLASWMILCDGDYENPYRIHINSPVHLKRYRLFEEFMTSKRHEKFRDGMYHMIGQLDCLNSALRRHDARACQNALAEIRKHVSP